MNETCCHLERECGETRHEVPSVSHRAMYTVRFTHVLGVFETLNEDGELELILAFRFREIPATGEAIVLAQCSP